MMKSKFSDSELLAIKLAWQEMERDRILKIIETEMLGRDSWLSIIELIKGEK